MTSRHSRPQTILTKILQSFRTVVFCLYSACFWLPFILFSIITWRAYSDKIFYCWARAWARHSLCILGIKLQIANPEISDDIHASVLISNHQSTLDFLIWGALLPPRTIGIGKSEIAYVPYGNLIWWASRFVFLHRDEHDRALNQLTEVRRRMKEDRVSVVIMPEGTRTPDGQMHEFKYGAFLLATETQRPIRPLVITGAYELLPRQCSIPASGTIQARFLDEVPTHEWDEDNLDPQVDSLYQHMLQAQRELSTV